MECPHCKKSYSTQRGLDYHLWLCKSAPSIGGRPQGQDWVQATEPAPQVPPTETTDVYELLLEANLDCDDSVAESGGEESSIDIYSNDDADDNEATTDDNEFPTNDGPTEELREDPWRFVDTPSTIDLPDEIQDNMFVPPDDFSSDWFAKAVKAGGDGIGFGYAAG